MISDIIRQQTSCAFHLTLSDIDVKSRVWNGTETERGLSNKSSMTSDVIMLCKLGYIVSL